MTPAQERRRRRIERRIQLRDLAGEMAGIGASEVELYLEAEIVSCPLPGLGSGAW